MAKALGCAAVHGDLEVVKLLHKLACLATPARRAAAGGHLEVVNFLVEESGSGGCGVWNS